MTEPKREGPLMPVIRYLETGVIWGLALLLTLASGILLLVWHMTQSYLGSLWVGATVTLLLYSVPRLRGWQLEGERLHDDLRKMKR